MIISVDFSQMDLSTFMVVDGRIAMHQLEIMWRFLGKGERRLSPFVSSSTRADKARQAFVRQFPFVTLLRSPTL